mgnify:FL=1
MENNELDLSQLRQRIDQLDHEIARLLTERMEIISYQRCKIRSIP